MSKLQVLVTTMHQTDFSKLEMMNIQTDVLFANQADTCSHAEILWQGCRAEMVTTKTRGTSRNRNTAIIHSSAEAEYVLFADDDLTFVEGYEKLVEDAFAEHPQADAIRFNTQIVSGRNPGLSYKGGTFKKAKATDVTSFGVNGLVIKRQVLLKNNLHFNESFGPGTDNFCGEDSIFLQDLIKSGVGFYLSPVKLGDISAEVSTWYEGKTPRYFETAGMVLAAIFPRLSPVLAVRSAYKASRRSDTELGFGEILTCYRRGIQKHLKG